jgi:hypothetical protein
MLFIDNEGNYPRHHGDLLLVEPNWQNGNALPEGWQLVAYATEMPIENENETVYEAQPELVNGVLTQAFRVRALTPAEIEEIARNEALRSNRFGTIETPENTLVIEP